ncbi:MAG: hypothetical protein ACAH59_06320 [Pseudobdellovibrionaceae bacterium]
MKNRPINPQKREQFSPRRAWGRIRANCLRSLLLSALFGLITIRSFQAGAWVGLSCNQVHSLTSAEAKLVSQQRESLANLDEAGIRKAFYSYLNKYGSKAPKQIDVTDSKGQVQRIDLPENLKKQFDPIYQLNRSVLGIFGEIFEFQWRPEQRKMILASDQKRQNELRTITERKLKESQAEDLGAMQALIAKCLPVRTLDDQIVLVRASLVSRGRLNGFEQAVLHRYQQMGMKTVDFVYRLSGLEKKRPLTGATMIDEVVSILKQGRGYNINLAFDPKVWALELQLMAGYYRKFQDAKTSEEKAKIIGEVNQGVDPFQPFSGVVTTDFLVPNGHPTEIKRYFHNPYEDPLGFLNLPAKNEYLLRLKMLLQVARELSADIPLEIHAHTKVHMRLYGQMGFGLFRETENPLYPGVPVYVLRGEKTEVVKKVTAILERFQESE